jgi:hypothetical protein
MSMLGFSADIHLGKWDDSKYVNDRRKEVEEEEEATEKEKRFDPAVARSSCIADLAERVECEATAAQIIDEKLRSAGKSVNRQWWIDLRNAILAGQIGKAVEGAAA